jgi:hypothetical protein
MKMMFLFVVAGSVITWGSDLRAAAFATSVEFYDPGVGYATEFETGLGYTDPATVLGAPNPETSFGSVQPFNPPFERRELLSLGVNGALTVGFDTLILNDRSHPFGLDFIVYGSAGFVDVDWPNGHTDEQAGLFGHNTGATRIWVSEDNANFFQLDPLLAATVDGLYPTDGAGTFGLPVDPTLTQADFANKSLAEVRALYGGSAGGAGYDLSWARDDQGSPVVLDSARYVRIEVLSGRAEIDGLAVVPEPSGTAILVTGGVLGVLLAGGAGGCGLNGRKEPSCRGRDGSGPL